MMMARPNTRAVCGTTALSVAPSRTCKCQSSGRAMVSFVPAAAAATAPPAAVALLLVTVRRRLQHDAATTLGGRTASARAILCCMSSTTSVRTHASSVAVHPAFSPSQGLQDSPYGLRRDDRRRGTRHRRRRP